MDDHTVVPAQRNDLSGLFLVRGMPPDIKCLEVVPHQIKDMQVNLAEGAEREWLVQQLTDLSEEFGTKVEAALHGLVIPITSG